MKNRGLLIAIAIFIVLLSTGIVYAVEYGTLTFTGRVARTYVLNLDLTSVTVGAPRPGEIVEIADVNKKSMFFNLLLIEPGDSRTITFHILNTGNMAARLGNLNTSDPDISTVLVVTWPSLDDILIMPGQNAGPFTVTVTWDAGAQNVISGSVNFGAYIDYAQT